MYAAILEKCVLLADTRYHSNVDDNMRIITYFKYY